MDTASRTFERRTRQRMNAATLAARGEPYHAKRLLDCVLQDEQREAIGYRTWHCQQRNCLYCGRKYWKRRIRPYRPTLENLMAISYPLSFLTLTIPNVPWLNPQLYK